MAPGSPGGKYVPEAVGLVISSGATVQQFKGFWGSLRLRYFGPRNLTSDANSTDNGGGIHQRFPPRRPLPGTLHAGKNLREKVKLHCGECRPGVLSATTETATAPAGVDICQHVSSV